jgi:hypothetical protein
VKNPCIYYWINDVWSFDNWELHERKQMREDFPTSEERIYHSQKEARSLFPGALLYVYIYAFPFHIHAYWVHGIVNIISII